MESLLEVRDLRVRYRSDGREPFTAVDGVSFDIARGQTLGLMGESGCGKSTTALAMLGLLPKDRVEVSGSMRFGELELNGLDERAFQEIRGAAISIVYQEPTIALSPVMGVGEQVAEVVHAHRGWDWKQCRAEARAMLERVGLQASNRIFFAYPHQLSGGQSERVVLAQALACAPRLLIADEPTAHLDARSEKEFLELLGSLKQRLGLSMLLISHSPEVQARAADRVLIMNAGRIVEQREIGELHGNAADGAARNKPASEQVAR